MRIAVLASGRGTNFEAIASAQIKGKMRNAKVVLLITDKEHAPVRERARRHGIKEIFVNPCDHKSREAFDKRLVKIIKAEHIDLVVLAGYMRILSPCFVRAFKSRIINIHPALLPAFKGVDAIARAWRHGVKVTGVTVHFLDEKVDHGPIIAQKSFHIREGETLESVEERIHRIEHKIYPEVITRIVEGKIKIRGRHVRSS